MRHGFQIVLVSVNTTEMVPERKLQNIVSIMLVSGLLLLFSFGTVTCLKCQAKSNTYDPFLDISLDVKNVSTILRALERFVEPETLDTDNAYNCTKYGITGGKVTRHITFPEVLDVRPYVSTARGSNSGARAVGDPDDSNMAMEYKYRLYGVLVHEGHSTSSGHYYCYVSTSNGAWYCMNDHMVRRSSLNQVLNAEAYLLFYKRGVVSSTSSGATLRSDVNQIPRSIPIRECRSKLSVANEGGLNSDSVQFAGLPVSVTPNQDQQESASPVRKSACLGGQQILPCEITKSQRLLPPRLACRGGQMNSSLMSVSSASRQIRKNVSASAKTRKDMARYRHAVKKSCCDRKKISDISCRENCPPHSELQENNSDSSCLPVFSAIPRVLSGESCPPLGESKSNKTEDKYTTEEIRKSCSTDTLQCQRDESSSISKDSRPAAVVTDTSRLTGMEKSSTLGKSGDIKTDGECNPSIPALPRIVLKIRQGRIVEPAVTDTSYDFHQDNPKSQDKPISKAVSCQVEMQSLAGSESSKREKVGSDKSVLVASDKTVKDAATFDKDAKVQCSSQSVNLSSGNAPTDDKPPAYIGSYDKLSQDYFMKLSKMCADVQNSSAARLTASHQPQSKPAPNGITQKSVNSISDSRVQPRTAFGKQKPVTPVGGKVSSHCTALHQSSKSQSVAFRTGNLNKPVLKNGFLSQPVDSGPSQPLKQWNAGSQARSVLNRQAGGDKMCPSKVSADKPQHQARGDVYDFDMGDDTDNECCSVTLAVHRQNSLTNTERDGVPTATVDVPGAYGCLAKTKRMFSNRSHTAVALSQSLRNDATQRNGREVQQVPNSKSALSGVRPKADKKPFGMSKQSDGLSSFAKCRSNASERHRNLGEGGCGSPVSDANRLSDSDTSCELTQRPKNVFTSSNCPASVFSSGMKKTSSPAITETSCTKIGGKLNQDSRPLLGAKRRLPSEMKERVETDKEQPTQRKKPCYSTNAAVLETESAVFASTQVCRQSVSAESDVSTTPSLPAASAARSASSSCRDAERPSFHVDEHDTSQASSASIVDVKYNSVYTPLNRGLKSLTTSSYDLLAGSHSYSFQQSETLQKDSTAPAVGPIRLKIRVSNTNQATKIYNVVVPDSSEPTKPDLSLSCVNPVSGDADKRILVDRKSPNVETSGPGRGS